MPVSPLTFMALPRLIPITSADVGIARMLGMSTTGPISPDENSSSSGPVCQHHWRIEEANGQEFVEGQCKKCGETKTYRAWSDPYAGLNLGDLAHDLIFGVRSETDYESTWHA
jgi:hypothetical protein